MWLMHYRAFQLEMEVDSGSQEMVEIPPFDFIVGLRDNCKYVVGVLAV